MTVTIHGTEVEVFSTFFAMLVAGGLTALSPCLRLHGRPAGQSALIAAPIAGLAVGSALHGIEVVPDDVAWGAVLAGIVFAAMAAGARRHGSLVPWLVVVSSVGLYLTTPDTERAVIFGAVSVAVAVVHQLVPSKWPGLLAAPALLCMGWVAATDGEPRTAAVVAAIGCVGALPFLRLSAARDDVIVVAHVMAVFIASRVATRQDGAGEALAIVVLEFAVLLTAIVVFIPRVNDRE